MRTTTFPGAFVFALAATIIAGCAHSPNPEDGATPDLEPLDSAEAVDVAMADRAPADQVVSDLALADLSMTMSKDDLSPHDLSMLDLSMPDLSAPDLLMPDLFVGLPNGNPCKSNN